MKSGLWVGGYYGERSYTSGYPEAADLYLQTTWTMSGAGSFEHPLPHSGGIYIRMDDVEFLDFVEVPPGAKRETRQVTETRPQLDPNGKRGVPARRQPTRADAGSADAASGR
ncbi:hypothetical protein GCM10023238_11330 [Streptomyces heliomycini]